MNKTVWLAAAGVGALAVAGCSSSSKGSSPAPAGGGTGAQSAAMTVAVKNVSGHDVLVDTQGRSLYTSDQEMSGTILCKSSACLAIWSPLTVTGDQQPNGPSDVKLTTVARPDGKMQVALNGSPLYTFSFDHGSGDLKGDGQKDSFDGTDFVWHAATANGVAAPPATSGSTDNGGGGGGGYGY